MDSMYKKTAEIKPDLIDDPYVKRLIKRRFLQWAIDQADGNLKRVNWPKVSDVVAHHTGVRIKPETLRQNFTPVSKKQNIPSRNFRDKQTWRCLFDFLVSDAVSYLHTNEIPKGPFVFSALAGLQAFINPAVETVFPSGLNGRFSNLLLERDMDDAVALDFLGVGAIGPVRVEMREYGDNEFSDEESEGGLSYEGGAVHQQDGMIVVIMRESFSGKVKLFPLMQTFPALNKDAPVRDIALSVYEGLSDQPLERVETSDRDDTLAEPGLTITHRFGGKPHAIFLTQC